MSETFAKYQGAGKQKGNVAPEKMSVDVLLRRWNMQEYFQFFDKAGYKLIDFSAKFSDQQVEHILLDVEKQCGIRFNHDVKVRLWKALRYQWFHGPRPSMPFYMPGELPKLFLPKRDYRQVDSMIKVSDLDPDRQRQITRTTKAMTSTGRGPGLQILQFEVYRRQTTLWYEYKDLQRCVAEWQRKNPRTMLHEDPREEVMKMRIRKFLDQAMDAMEMYMAKDAHQFWTYAALLGVQLIMGAMALLMFFTAYYRYRDSPLELWIDFIGGSKQLISGVAFLQAFVVAFVVTQRRRVNVMIKRMKHAMISGERLMEQISDFRIETNDMRIFSGEQKKDEEVLKAAHVISLGASAPLDGARQRKKHRKKKRDKALGLWVKDMHPDMHEKSYLEKAIDESYLRLPPAPEGIRRQGGNRMLAFEHRLGGTNEEELCVRAHRLQNPAQSEPPALELRAASAMASQLELGPRADSPPSPLSPLRLPMPGSPPTGRQNSAGGFRTPRSSAHRSPASPTSPLSHHAGVGSLASGASSFWASPSPEPASPGSPLGTPPSVVSRGIEGATRRPYLPAFMPQTDRSPD